MRTRVTKEFSVNSFLNKEVKLTFDKPFTGELIFTFKRDNGIPTIVSIEVKGIEIL